MVSSVTEPMAGLVAVVHSMISMFLVGSPCISDDSVMSESLPDEQSESWDLGPDINLKSNEPMLESRPVWLVVEAKSQDSLVLRLRRDLHRSIPMGEMCSPSSIIPAVSCLFLGIAVNLMAITDVIMAIFRI